MELTQKLPEIVDLLVANPRNAPVVFSKNNSDQLVQLLCDRKKPAELYRLAETLSGDGHDFEASRLYGHGSFIQKNYTFSIAAFEAALEIGELCDFDLLILARSYRLNGNPVDALETLYGATASPEHDIEIAIETAIAMTDDGEQENALEAAKDLLVLPDDRFKKMQNRTINWFAAYLAGAQKKPVTVDISSSKALTKRWEKADDGKEADIVFAVLDYKSPDFLKSSKNIGDFVQTVAVMRHVARHLTDQITASDKGLPKIIEKLRATWSKDALSTTKQSVHLTVLDRDMSWPAATLYRDQKVFTIIYGWHLHEAFETGNPFPLPDNVRPVFLSFYLQRPQDLNLKVVNYLKKYQPIGCRDWSTTYWLLNQGIEAFFSGCVTLTLSLPEVEDPAGGKFYVDTKAPDGTGKDYLIDHNIPPTRLLQFSKGIDSSIQLLEKYKSAEFVTTSRLHCFLPCRALGTPVEFRSSNGGDRRFDGLIGVDQKRHDQIADQMTGLIDGVLTDVFSKAKEQTLYKNWRTATKPLVKAARKKLYSAPHLFAGKELREQAKLPEISTVKKDPKPDHVNVALAFDENLLPQVPVLIRSILANTGAKITFILLVRGLTEMDVASLTNEFSEAEFRFFEMSEYLQSVKIRLAGNTTISTMDRLFLPQLVSDIDRLVYIDVDIILNGDIAELARFKPSSRGIAARPTPTPIAHLQVQMIERACRDFTPEVQREYRRMTAACVNLTSRYFNAGVLVLSLETLRQLDLTSESISLVERFGLEDQEALNLFAAGDFTILPDSWNTNPSLDWTNTADLLHWAGALKPWMKARNARLSHFWHKYDIDQSKGKVSDEAFWSNAANFASSWDARARMAAAYIKPDSKVLDIGCGRMTLERELPKGCQYIPADLTKWTDRVVKVDLNSGGFPNGEFDTITLLGVLEYLNSPDQVLKTAASRATQLVTSYTVPRDGSTPGFRKSRRWVNTFSEDKIQKMLKKAGWTLEHTELCNENPRFRQLIFIASRAI